jgi:hypothetical protein
MLECGRYGRAVQGRIWYIEYQCLSLRRNWVPTPPPPWTQRWEKQHSLAGEEVGGPNSDDRKESLALYIGNSVDRAP